MTAGLFPEGNSLVIRATADEVSRLLCKSQKALQISTFYRFSQHPLYPMSDENWVTQSVVTRRATTNDGRLGMGGPDERDEIGGPHTPAAASSMHTGLSD